MRSFRLSCRVESIAAARSAQRQVQARRGLRRQRLDRPPKVAGSIPARPIKDRACLKHIERLAHLVAAQCALPRLRGINLRPGAPGIDGAAKRALRPRQRAKRRRWGLVQRELKRSSENSNDADTSSSSCSPREARSAAAGSPATARRLTLLRRAGSAVGTRNSKRLRWHWPNSGRAASADRENEYRRPILPSFP
jgi:hypothetical protein